MGYGYDAAKSLAAIKNGKATSIDELTIGVNDEILKKAGVTMLNEQQKAKIESGEIETLFVFGDDICDLDTSKVKNTEIIKLEF